MNKNFESILVTGGAGYIGSHVVEQLIKKKLNVVILDNLMMNIILFIFMMDISQESVT